MKAFLLSAGFGTRLKPFTDHHPKALARVNGRTLLEWNIKMLQKYGINDVVVNVHHFAGQIITFLDEKKGFGSKIYISDERDAILETGGGLRKARPFLENEPAFLVMNADILSDININNLLQYHHTHKPLVTLAVQRRHSSRYFLFDTALRLKGWENIQTGAQKCYGTANEMTRYAFSGIQVISNEIFPKINREGKFSLVDLYLDLCNTETLLAWDHTSDLLLDVGKPESLTKASTLFK